MMTEATWGDAARTPAIDWTMSAALENVVRAGGDIAEVTNLKAAVREWQRLDAEHRTAAVLTPEHAVMIDGAAHDHFAGDGITALAELLADEPPSPEVA